MAHLQIPILLGSIIPYIQQITGVLFTAQLIIDCMGQSGALPKMDMFLS